MGETGGHRRVVETGICRRGSRRDTRTTTSDELNIEYLGVSFQSFSPFLALTYATGKNTHRPSLRCCFMLTAGFIAPTDPNRYAPYLPTLVTSHATTPKLHALDFSALP